MAEWQLVETAPRMKTILLYAVTERASDGTIVNAKMATGFYHQDWEAEDGSSPWNWDGRHVKPWEHEPTHWQLLPDPPELP